MKTLVRLALPVLATIAGLVAVQCKAQQPPNRDKTAKKNVEGPMNEYLKPYGLKVGCPVFIRIIKEDRILELWGKPEHGDSYLLIKKYPIAGMSGKLGPKQKEGDYQAPEGFYQVTKQGLNPNSQYHLSFNIGYPNAYDLALNRTGSLIMVHGSNVSIGCFAITNPGIEEVYTMVAEALNNGQEAIEVHIYPFVPTPARMHEARDSEFHAFWETMEKAWHLTEKNRRPPTCKIHDKELTVTE